jgi:hypothetical protein
MPQDYVAVCLNVGTQTTREYVFSITTVPWAPQVILGFVGFTVRTLIITAGGAPLYDQCPSHIPTAAEI